MTGSEALTTNIASSPIAHVITMAKPMILRQLLVLRRTDQPFAVVPNVERKVSLTACDADAQDPGIESSGSTLVTSMASSRRFSFRAISVHEAHGQMSAT